MSVSVVISTYNRVNDLNEALDSVIKQTTLPQEIIIVDDSSNDKVKCLISNIKSDFENKSIELKYIRKNSKGISKSRNIGIENSKGDMVFFFDDDSVLDKEYISEILKVYEKYPNALGVQGYITNRKRTFVKNIFNKIFFLVHSRKNINCFLPSIQNVYANPLDKIINCQWMISNNFSFKREILDKFKFDENIVIPDGEDADLTYRIYKKFPTSLYQTPFAKVYHKGYTSFGARSKTTTYIIQLYQLYFFYKNVEQTLKNKFIFLWSRIGLLLIAIGVTILRLPEAKALKPLDLIGSYLFCLKHLKTISERNLDLQNKILK